MQKKENFSMVFAGKGIKNTLDVKSFTYKSIFLTSPEELIQFFRKGESFEKYSVLLKINTPCEVENFISQAEKQIPALSYLTPLILYTENIIQFNEDDFIMKFDHILFQLPEPKNLESMMFFERKRKNSIIRIEKQHILIEALLSDIFIKMSREGDEPSGIKSVYSCILGLDENGIINTINNQVLEILGYSRDDIIGRHFSELLFHRESEKIRHVFSERRTGKRHTKGAQVTLRAKDGTPRDFLVDAQGVHIPSMNEKPAPHPYRVHIGTFLEARCRGDVREELDVFDLSYEPILIYNLTEKRLIANRGFEKLSGYTHEELNKMYPGELEREDRSFFSDGINIVKENKHYEYNTVLVSRSKEEHSCEVSLDYFMLDGKEYVIAFYNDVSTLLRLFDEAQTVIGLSWDTGNVDSLKKLVETASSRVLNVVKVPFFTIGLLGEGYQVDEYYTRIGENDTWIKPEKTRFHPWMNKLITEAIKEKKTVFRSTINIPDYIEPEGLGDIGRAGVCVILPLIVQQNILGCIGVIHPRESRFTLQGLRVLELSANVIANGIHRLHLEREIRNNLQTLEFRVQERTRELEDFVYIVSHDLKSPLHAAKGFTDMVKSRLAPCITEEEDEYILRRIDENINQAIRMINDLLKLSRIGTQSLNLESVNIGSIIDEYFIQLRALNREDVRIETEISGSLPTVYADRGQIVQLFTNIFDNAIKYRKGNLVKIKVRGEVKKDMVSITVTDYGIGISKKDLPNVFKVFYRGSDHMGYPIKEGTGLGLTIVQKIVQRHGGNVSIQSNDQGTSVTVELPLLYG